MRFNSLYQLLALQRDRSPLLDMAETLLMVPDLFHYFFTGQKVNEFTDVSTNQMYDPTAHGALVAQVYDAFNGPLHDQDPGAAGLLAFDDFHPNAAGHALIASRLRALGYFTVTP